MRREEVKKEGRSEVMRSKEGTKVGIIAKINYCHARMSCVSLLLAEGHNLKGSDLLTISCSSRNSYIYAATCFNSSNIRSIIK